MNSPAESIESATAYYNRILVEEHLSSTREALAELNADPRVSPDGSELARWLRPTFVAEGSYERAARDGMAVVHALHRAAEFLHADRNMCELLRLESSLGWRLFVDHGVRGVRVNGRLDGLPTRDGRVMFAEYNTNLTGGLVHSEVFPRRVDAMPVMRAFRDRFPTRISGVPGLASKALRQAHERAGGNGAPCFFVAFSAASDDVLDVEAFEAMVTLQQMSPEDVRVVVDAPSALEYRGGALWADELRVDVLYAPDMEWPNIFSVFGLDHPLFTDAIPQGRVRILNGASLGGLVAEKSLFEVLSRPDLQHLFDTQTQEVLHRTIPWTRFVSQRSVDHHGTRVDLVDLAVKRQSEFVLKPTHEQGGEGVVLGWAVDARTWEETLRAAMDSPYVLQERIDLEQQPFPTWTGDSAQVVPCRYSIDLFVWNDLRIAGSISRVSRSEMLNVSGGASPNAVFILDGVER